MSNRSRDKHEEGELGSELEKLLASVPPAKAPPWFAAKVLARLRTEREAEAQRKWSWMPKWRWLIAGTGCAVLAVGFFHWKDTPPTVSDRAVFAALDALVKEDADNRWWAGL
jgi:hypothetical protein